MGHFDYIQIGNRIKSRRRELKITQKELGVTVNLSEASVSKYEAGKVEYATSKLNEFAIALGVELTWLLGIKNETEKDSNKSFKTIAAHYDGVSLSEDEQEEISNYIKFVLSKRDK